MQAWIYPTSPALGIFNKSWLSACSLKTEGHRGLHNHSSLLETLRWVLTRSAHQQLLFPLMRSFIWGGRAARAVLFPVRNAPAVALPVTHHLQKPCCLSYPGVSSPSLAHSPRTWAAARGTARGGNFLTAGKRASLLLIFRCCTSQPLLAVDVGLGGRNRNIKQNIYTLLLSSCWPWSVLDCADSEVLPQKHPWKGSGWGHQMRSPTTL